MTEGMQDEVINGRYRGWADRVADVMAKNYENFTYANLAVRGKLVGQVHREQVPVAIGLVNGPSTIISFHAGANDVIRPKYDPAKTIDTYNDAVDQIMKSGATLMLFWKIPVRRIRRHKSGKNASMSSMTMCARKLMMLAQFSLIQTKMTFGKTHDSFMKIAYISTAKVIAA
jgi:lysophospholipase L1-like esterase